MITKGTIHIKTYDCYVTVIFTDGSINKIHNRLTKKYGEEAITKNIEPGGMAFSPDVDISQYFILIPLSEGKICIGTLVHELDHIKNYILGHRQVHYNTQDDESGAYLIGHLTEAVHKIMAKKNIEFHTS